MNRRQRRAEKKQNHDPTYTVKRSEMKAHIDRLLNSEEVRRAIRAEADRVNLEVARQQDCDIITLILMSLHQSEGYGRKRLLRFCSTFNELQKYYEGLYEDCDLFAMRKHLRENVGVDVERINEEVEKYVKENSTEG